MDSPVYNELNKAWKSTCRIVLGGEVGELKEYEEWLREYLPPIGKRKSHISGKEVTLTVDDYCKTAKIISLEEVKEKAVPLSINEIKDIDSILEAISDKWEYAGNIILGNSRAVEGSTLVLDSNYVGNSLDVKKSEYVYSSSEIYFSKFTMGCINTLQSEFMLGAIRTLNSRRCFSTHLVGNSGDIYFCSNCFGCQEVLFSFSQQGKKNCIGNLELPKDKYLQLKKKLISEIRDELIIKKKFPTLFELVSGGKPSEITISVKEEPKGVLNPIEKAFSTTSRILFKRELGPLSEYEKYISSHIPLSDIIRSPFGHMTYKPNPKLVPAYTALDERRLVSFEEGLELGKMKLNEDDIGSLAKIMDSISKIGYISMEIKTGVNTNIIASPAVQDVSHSYKVERSANAEYIALSYLVPLNKYTFGSLRCSNNQFIIKCYNSLNLNRCFEVDASTNCSDTYFTHNCEGLQEAMFCFNTKGKRYAIGNTELPPDKYRSIKDTVIGQLADELERTKELKLDIFNLGCWKKK